MSKCSGGLGPIWRFLTGHNPPFESACEAHDAAYRLGGPYENRVDADAALAEAIANTGHPILAFFAFLVVQSIGWTRWGKP